MKEHIGLGVFGTFGQPNGYQQIFFFDTYFNSSLDLNTNALELFPNTELYTVRKELVNGVFSVSFCIYSFAKELKSARGGTFIGTCVVLNEGYVKASDIYFLLKELYDDTVNNPKNILNYKIQVGKAAELEIRKPLKFEEVKSKVISINETAFRSDHITSDKNFLVKNNVAGASKETRVISFFEYAFENFSEFETVYFTFDASVVNHIQNKGILEIIEWGDFAKSKKITAKQKSERAGQVPSGSATIETVQLLKNDGKIAGDSVLPSQKSDDNKNPLVSYEDQEETLNEPDTFSLSQSKPFHPWYFNNEQLTLHEIKEKADEYNRLLNYCMELQEDLGHLNNVPVTTKAKHRGEKINLTRKKKRNVNVINIFIVLVSLSILVVMCFLLLNKPQKDYIVLTLNRIFTDTVVTQDSVTSNHILKKSTVDTAKILPLSPLPNTELDEHDLKRLNETDFDGKSGMSIVKLIFDKNRADIGYNYKGQEMAYLLWLKQNNKNCFTKVNNNDTCTCSKLSHIAAVKHKEGE